MPETADGDLDLIDELFSPQLIERYGESGFDKSQFSRKKRHVKYDGYRGKHFVEIAPLRRKKTKDGKTPLAIILAATDLIEQQNDRKGKQRIIGINKKNKNEIDNHNNERDVKKYVKQKSHGANDNSQFSFNKKPVSASTARKDVRKKVQQIVEESDSESLIDDVRDVNFDQHTQDLVLNVAKSLLYDHNEHQNEAELAESERKETKYSNNLKSVLYNNDEDVSKWDNQEITNVNYELPANSSQQDKVEYVKKSGSHNMVRGEILQSTIGSIIKPDKSSKSTIDDSQDEISRSKEHISRNIEFNHRETSDEDSSPKITTKENNVFSEEDLRIHSTELPKARNENIDGSSFVEESNEMKTKSDNLLKKYDHDLHTNRVRENPLTIESSSSKDDSHLDHKLIQLIIKEDKSSEDNALLEHVSFRNFQRPWENHKDLQSGHEDELNTENGSEEDIIGDSRNYSELKSDEDLLMDKDNVYKRKHDKEENRDNISTSVRDELKSENNSNEDGKKLEEEKDENKYKNHLQKYVTVVIEPNDEKEKNNEGALNRGDTGKLMYETESQEKISNAAFESYAKIVSGRYSNLVDDLSLSDFSFSSSDELQDSYSISNDNDQGDNFYDDPYDYLPAKGIYGNPIESSQVKFYPKRRLYAKDSRPNEEADIITVQSYENKNVPSPSDLIGVMNSFYDSSEFGEKADKECQEKEIALEKQNYVGKNQEGSNTKTYILSFRFNK